MPALADAYDAATQIMAAVNTAAPTTIVQAPSNYGTDFRITPGEGLYQVKILAERDRPRSNQNYPRAIASVLLHHFVTTLTNEENFLHITMNELADRWLVESIWQAESGIFSFDPGVDPEIDEGERVGNVISFEASAVVLMNPV